MSKTRQNSFILIYWKICSKGEKLTALMTHFRLRLENFCTKKKLFTVCTALIKQQKVHCANRHNRMMNWRQQAHHNVVKTSICFMGTLAKINIMLVFLYRHRSGFFCWNSAVGFMTLKHKLGF